MEEIQVTECLLTTGRHNRIKQIILDMHVAELRVFNSEYGEKAGKLCVQFCQGPLFDDISDQIPEEILEHVLAATSEVLVENEEVLRVKFMPDEASRRRNPNCKSMRIHV